MAKRQQKSESLTIRLDPKTRFMLEFIARLRGQPLTTVVERAISAAADQATIRDERNGFGLDETWRDFWNINEGIRALLIAAEPKLHPTYEEERRLHFARKFWPFFYQDAKCQGLRGDFIEILWPRIDEFIETHEREKRRNAWAVAEAMQMALAAAQLNPPAWPPKDPGPIGRRNDPIPEDPPF